MSAHIPRFKARVLTVFLLIGLPILAVAIGIALAIGQARLSVSFGQHLQQVAQQTAAAVDSYVSRRIVDVALLGRVPELRREARAGSLRPLNMDAVKAMDAQWREAKETAPVAAILANEASQYLGDIVAHDRVYKEILLTDRFGRLVAASNRTSNYYQGDEDWWKAAVEDGRRGAVTMSDVRWDESAKVHAIEISVPVPEPGGEGLAGVLKVVADSREMLATVGGVELGTTGEAVLLRDNGSIVYSRRQTDPNARFFAAETLRERVAMMRQGGPEAAGTHFRASVPPDDEPWLVGIARSGAAIPNVAWVVAVSQSQAELLAPVRALWWYMLTALGSIGLLVLGLALYFSMRLAAPQVEEDLHLVEHPAVSHVGDADTEQPAVHSR